MDGRRDRHGHAKCGTPKGPKGDGTAAGASDGVLGRSVWNGIGMLFERSTVAVKVVPTDRRSARKSLHLVCPFPLESSVAQSVYSCRRASLRDKLHPSRICGLQIVDRAIDVHRFGIIGHQAVPRWQRLCRSRFGNERARFIGRAGLGR
eukprot:scaffold19060_cov33-Tisochrysis_lutea.AAC.1